MTPPQVVIIGSGPAGISAAVPLLAQGIRVMMLDASQDTAAPPSPTGDIAAFRRDPARWRTQFGPDLAGLAPQGDQSPKLATPLARHTTAHFAAATALDAHGFTAIGSLGQGGLSAIWGGVAAQLDATDLAEWPFPAADLAPSYADVMARIGVSGDDGPALSPAMAAIAHTSHGHIHPGVTLRRAVNAVAMQDRDGRQSCASCGLCLWGCARGSVYSAAHDLPGLRAMPVFDYRPNHRVTRLTAIDDGIAVEGPGFRIEARHLILAAGTIATTALLARHLGQHDTPIRLLTNPVAACAFVIPRLIGTALPGRSFALAQMTHTVAIGGGQIVAGALYGADTLPAREIANRLPFSRPVALRLARALAPALLLATLYLPGRWSANVMRVGADGLTIEGGRAPGATRALRRAAQRLGSAMRRLGAFPLPGSFAASPPGADAHYAGTIPMGGAGPMRTNQVGELTGAPGIYVVDGAALPMLPARHCTLTIMANADRIGRILAKTLSPDGPAA